MVSQKYLSFNDELTTNSAVMSISAVIAGAFSYLYQVYMGRALGPEDFGVFGALFAIFYSSGSTNIYDAFFLSRSG